MEFKLWAILWDGGEPSIKIDLLTGNRKLSLAWRLRWLLRFWRKLELVLVVQLKRAEGQPPGLGWELAQGAERRADP